MLTGIYCRNKEIYEGLKKEIKMFEQERECNVTLQIYINLMTYIDYYT